MCSGRIDPAFVLEAFKDGADGVLIAGCHLPSDCHYISGNHKTMARIPLLREMLAQMGIDQERLQLHWVSASEGARYAEIVTKMTEQVRQLGPLDWNHRDEDNQ